MERTRVSRRYQIVIPKEVRREIGLKSGQSVQIISKGGVIAMVPDQPIGRMRGYLKGMKTRTLREKKDRR